MKITKVFHAGLFAHLEIWLPLIKTNNKLIIFNGYYLRMYADIPRYDFGLPTLDFCGCILRTYADIPNNDFERPTLDYLRIWASTS